MELYCVVSVVMEFLELDKYAKRGIRYDFPLNYLFEKETACSLRWTATRVLQISNRSPIYLSAAWTLSIQLSIDNWILISRFPSTHSLWYIFQFFVVCLFVVFSYSFIDTFIILILAELSVVCTQNRTLSQWNQIRAQSMKIDIQWKSKMCDVTFIAK